MTVYTLIKRSEYHDSVTLMLAARELGKLPGVQDAAVMMATEANQGLMKNAGLLTPEAAAAGPNDLVIAVAVAEGESATAEQALAAAEKLLSQPQAGGGTTSGGSYRPKTLLAALKANPAANFAVISVAGRYAAAEAWEALRHGLHVLLFSDNVTLEDEAALKRYAVEHGLLLMGPGAGTAIINGVALGFANVLPSGPVGLVSAAGTGLQEVSTLLARRGVGISQGLGTGGRDLKAEVGGLMFLAGLKALQADPATQVIVLVSKPPAAAVAQQMLAQAAQSAKPTVVCFLGGDFSGFKLAETIRVARTLEEAADLAVQLVTGQAPAAGGQWSDEQPEAGPFAPSQRALRALFSGGTLCYEAQVIWREALKAPVWSNAPLDHAQQMPDSTVSQGHCAIDLGEEEFTVGRPHPMIDNDLRIRRMLQEAKDPETAVLVLDVVLGYGAHPDPAAELGPAIRQAKELAQAAGRDLPVIVSVTGTEQDPQGYSRQAAALRAAGAEVCYSNAAAARSAAVLINMLAPGELL